MLMLLLSSKKPETMRCTSKKHCTRNFWNEAQIKQARNLNSLRKELILETVLIKPF